MSEDKKSGIIYSHRISAILQAATAAQSQSNAVDAARAYDAVIMAAKRNENDCHVKPK